METSIIEETDSINCGKCCQTFVSFDSFKNHKLSGCNFGRKSLDLEPNFSSNPSSSNSIISQEIDKFSTVTSERRGPDQRTMIIIDNLNYNFTDNSTEQSQLYFLNPVDHTTLSSFFGATAMEILVDPQQTNSSTSTGDHVQQQSPHLSSFMDTNGILMSADSEPRSNVSKTGSNLEGDVEPGSDFSERIQNEEEKIKPAKKRNKVMRILPAKVPLNLASKKSWTREGSTVTQTQTYRVFKLSCVYCEKRFCKKFDLDAHLRIHTGEKPFRCSVCRKGFAQKSNVKKHLSSHKVWPNGRSSLPHNLFADTSGQSLVDVITSYFCQYCDERFSKWPKLSSHLAIKHKDEQVFKCRVVQCNDTFKKLEDFLNHLKEHDPDELKFRCDKCDLMLDSLHEMKIHRRQHNIIPSSEESLNTKFSCAKCKQKFSSAKSLKEHAESSSHVIPCNGCSDKFFISEVCLRKHLREQHAVVKHTCDFCGKSFKSKSILASHYKTHGPSVYECEDQSCKKTFKRKDQLSRHRLTHQRRRFHCPHSSICSRNFARRDQLAYHLKTHGSLRPWKCRICGKGFLSKSHLNEHESTHKGSRKFKCSACDRNFLRRSQLENHLCVPDVGSVNLRRDRKARINAPEETQSGRLKASVILRSGRKTRPTKRISDLL